MASKYKTFTLDELEALINKKAVDIMMQPQKMFMGEQATKVESLGLLNDRIAQYNEGIRALAIVLVNELNKEDDDA